MTSTGFDGNSLSAYTSTKGVGYQFVNPEAAALVARFATSMDDTRKGLIDARFTAGKAKSFWAKLDALWVHAAHGAEAARLNWLGDFYNCIPINNPVFTTDRGYLGDGSSSYLDTQFNPATAVGAKYSQNSGALGVRSNTNNTNTGSLAGFFATTGTTINPRSNGNGDATFRVNQPSASVATAMSPNAIGMFVTNRVGAIDIRGYREGQLILNAAEASVAPVSGAFRLGSIGPSSFRACEFSMGFISSGLTNQEVQDIYDWFEPYRITVGVT